ncbi:ABC transporter ATP-binding protein [Rhizobium sp. FKY42]|uniref:ABC transporter ATP-binding protein n=1 Tax=Rhizobium sp. FKY42 TaxID=2562310 RepID=UPI0010BFF00B|nr:ABC transporter ATP-binding protein [Rhizobium sp. FKY42]
MSFVVEHMTWGIGSKTILKDVSVDIPAGKMVGLIGPNGSGKTSLLRLLAGLKTPTSGSISLAGSDLNGIPRKKLARRIAFVEQHAATNASLTVSDVVRLGRFPHRSLFSGWSLEDQDAVEQAMESTGIDGKRFDKWQSLSGGEKQRVQIARALAQSPQELILDEPTNHLDIQHQISLLKLVSELPMTTVIALHDLNHAALFCDELVVLQNGSIVATGSPADVLTEQLLRDVFCVEARVEPSPYHDRPHLHFIC